MTISTVIHAADCDDVLAQLALARKQMELLATLVRQFVVTTPREGGWESTYRALQARARRILETLAIGKGPEPA